MVLRFDNWHALFPFGAVLTSTGRLQTTLVVSGSTTQESDQRLQVVNEIRYAVDTPAVACGTTLKCSFKAIDRSVAHHCGMMFWAQTTVQSWSYLGNQEQRAIIQNCFRVSGNYYYRQNCLVKLLEPLLRRPRKPTRLIFSV